MAFYLSIKQYNLTEWLIWFYTHSCKTGKQRADEWWCIFDGLLLQHCTWFCWPSLEWTLRNLSFSPPVSEPSHFVSPMQEALAEYYLHYVLCSKEGKNKNPTESKFKFINHSTSKTIQTVLSSDRDPAWLLLGSQDLKENPRPEAVTAQWGVLSSPIQREPTSTHRHGNTLTLQVLLWGRSKPSPCFCWNFFKDRHGKPGTSTPHQPEEIILSIFNKCPWQLDWIKN